MSTRTVTPDFYDPGFIARFWDKVSIGPKCWVWTATCDSSGYGSIHIKHPTHRNKRFMEKANRVMGIWMFGDLGDLYVCHTCDNRRCVRPDHLFLGTQKENVHDMERKGREVRTIGLINGRTKLRPNQVLEIKSRYKKGIPGHTARDLAPLYGIGPAQIFRIVHGRRWSKALPTDDRPACGRNMERGEPHTAECPSAREQDGEA